VRDLIRRGEIGDVRRISWFEGHKFDWPTQSGFYFRRPWGPGVHAALCSTLVSMSSIRSAGGFRKRQSRCLS
jgi:predicted dehydrogenase